MLIALFEEAGAEGLTVWVDGRAAPVFQAGVFSDPSGAGDLATWRFVWTGVRPRPTALPPASALPFGADGPTRPLLERIAADQAHFTRSFRARTNIPPARFRAEFAPRVDGL